MTEKELEHIIGRLIGQLYKPLFVFNMTRGDTRKGAETRRRNASKEILRVLQENRFELKQ